MTQPRPEQFADTVGEVLTNRMATHRVDLERLVRIPSVSAPGFDPQHVRDCAETVAALLAERGLANTQLLETEGAHPAVYADWLGAGDEAPTVLLYAHHDVQPPGEQEAWTTPPFAPAEREGRLYGRGTADDKGGLLVHVAAVDAWLTAHDRLPVNVKVIAEGEEEIGSEHLPAFLERYAERLAADVIVCTDAVNWKLGVPTVTYLLRGLVDCVVEVRALHHGVHSGMYGGPVPDALVGLIKLLGGLVDDQGAMAVESFDDDVRSPTDAERARIAALDFDEESFRRDAGMLPGVALTGDPERHPLERLWLRPNVTVIGIDAPRVQGSSNTLIPSARARLSVRLAPGQDPDRAVRVLSDWLTANAPWGLQVQVSPGAKAGAFVADPSGPVFEAAERALGRAFGQPVAFAGVGGTIPFIEPMAAAFGGVPALLTGVEDPDSRAHGIDESLHLGDWESACLGEAYLFAELADALAP